MDLTGQIAVVTGAGSGLGAETARALAAAGARVALLDRDLDRARAVAQQIGGHAVSCDVADAASAASAMTDVVQTLGRPRILVCCAGIAPAAKVVGKSGVMPLDDFARVISINLVGTFNLVRLAAAEMMTLEPLADGERGVMILTASVAAFEGQIGQAAYAASKGGVAALTLPLAREFAPQGIRVMTIAPGIFATPMMLAMPQAVQDSLAATVPFPARLGNPQEYADLALTICRNRMLNGSVIRLDGALRMAAR